MIQHSTPRSFLRFSSAAGLALAALLTASPGAAAQYAVDFDEQYTDQVHWWSSASGSTDGSTCERFYRNGAIRSWYLREHNARDFRKSNTNCRDMQSDGTLGDEAAQDSHFSYSGSGTTGNSTIPANKLPVGVRTLWGDSALFLSTKLQDVDLFYNDAEEIHRGARGHERAGPALGRGGIVVDLVCDPGYVLTGIQVKAAHEDGRNQAEIRGVKIECSQLDLLPTATITVR